MSLYRFPCGCTWPLLETETPEGCLPLLDINKLFAEGWEPHLIGGSVSGWPGGMIAAILTLRRKKQES